MTRSLRFWIWGAVLFSLGLCLAITWMHFQQDASLSRAERIFEGVREARIDLTKGFLHLALSGDERSPFRREEGLAMLDQAIALLSRADSRYAQDWATSEYLGSRGDFQKSVAEFRSELAAWKRAEGDTRRALELRLRVAFHQLERQSARVDLASRRELQALDARLDREFSYTLAVAIVLLGGICLGIYTVSRNERVAVEALRASEERLRLVGDNLPDGYVFQYVRAAGGPPRFTHISAGVQRVHGVTASEVLGDANRLLGQMDPGQQTAFAAAEAESARGLANFEMELRGQRPDGETREIYVRSRPRHLGDGIVQWDGFVVDITERKRAEERQRQEQALNKALIDSVPGTFYMLDAEGRYVRWNAYQRDEIVGKPDDQVAGFPALETIHPADRELIQSKIASVLTDGAQAVVEGRVLLRGGPDSRWMLMTGRRLVFNDRPYLVGIGIDITERKQADEVVRRSERLLRSILDNIPDPAWMKDPGGRFLAVNKAWCEFVGRTPEQAVGHLDSELFPPEAIAPMRERERKVVESCQPQQWEERLVDSLRISRTFETFAGPMLDEAGKVSALIGIARDITRRQRAEATLRSTLERVRHLNDVLLSIRDVTSLLSRKTDRPELLEGVCQSLVRTRGYVTVWIGEPDEAAGEVRPVAQAGAGEFELHAPIRWDDSPLGLGPTGTALRERRPVVFDDLANDPRFTPWRGPVVNSGAASIASVPLLHQARVFGVLTVKADHAGAFDAEEVSLLSDLAAKVALALKAQEDEAARAAVDAALRASEQRFRAYVEQAADAVFVHDFNGRLLDVNQRACESLGYSRAELLRMTVPDIDVDYTLDTAQVAWRQVRPGERYLLRGRHRRKDGTSFPVEVSFGVFDLEGQRIFLTLVRDITERIEAEQRTRLLRDLGLALAGVAELPEALRLCLRTALGIAGMDAGGLYLVDENSGDLVLACHAGLSAEFVAAASRYAADSPNTRWAQGGTFFHGDFEKLGLTSPEIRQKDALRALSVLPIRHDGRLVAVLNVASHALAEVPAAARPSLEAVASQVGGVLHRLRTQAALQENERRLAALFGNLPGMAYRGRNDRPRSMEFVSEGCLDLTGHSAAELTENRALTYAEVIHPDDREMVWAEIQKALEGRQKFQLSYRLRTASGGTQWVWEQGVGVYSPAGELLALEGFVTDVTAQRTAAAALAKYQLLSDHTRDIILFVRPETGRLVEANHAACAAYGYERDELLAKSLYDLRPAKARASAAGQLALAAQGWHLFETVHHRRDGRTFPVEVSSHAARIEGEHLLISVVRDISARKRMEDELRQFNQQLERRVAERTAELSREVAERKQAEARLRTLWSAVEQSPLAVVITDKASAIEYVNPAFEAQTGYPAAAVVGQNPRLLKSGVHPRAFYDDLWQTVLAGRIWHGELCNRRKDGTQFWIATAIAPIRDDEGNLTHFVALEEDITERRRIAAELRQAKETADAANRAKSRFLANMSHEIRTPLNAILGFAQLLQRDPTLTSEQRKHLNTINRGGEHLLRLISDVLDMSKIESGRMQVTVAECDFRTLLADMEAMFRPRAEAQGLRFEVVCATGVPIRLHTDAGKVRQVLLNVLGNAVKFTPRGGVRMHVASEPAPATTEGHAAARLCLEVADTGVGIPPQELERVFEPFEQTRSGQSQGGGTGLGMAISRQLARFLKGDLTVTSQVGVGSTFRFTFVAAVAEPAQAATPAAPARRGVRGLQPGVPKPLVLVADDSESNRRLLCKLLTRAGFTVREAVNGTAAVATCRAERPALVLMDRWMPGLDGLAAAQAIRADPAGRDVRILMVSGNVFDTPEAEWRSAGVDGFLSKPFEIDDLLARVGALLGLDYAQDEPAAAPAARPSLTPAAAIRLPAALRAEIREATETGDVDRLRELIQKNVTPVDAATGQALGDLVADFNYQAILSAFAEREHHD